MAEGRAQGLAYVFRPVDLAVLGLGTDRLDEVLEWSERLSCSAMTVTHPCKQQVLEYLDRIDPAAEALGAVNTVRFTPEGRIGYNTDTTGFETAYRESMSHVAIDHVVQLGAGGAGARRR